jgi:DNA-binding MarR family transcriptional regulator
MKNIYLTFLALADAITEKSAAHQKIDLDSAKLLELIAVKFESGTPLTVTQAMAMSHIGSPATLHRKIGLLLDSGLVEYEFQPNNRRTKYMKPTLTANQYFEQIGLALIQATK